MDREDRPPWKCTPQRTIAADRMTVWAALNDAEVLKACIPGL